MTIFKLIGKIIDKKHSIPSYYDFVKMFTITKNSDYYNDLEMLKFADICAVPEETPDDIKEIADLVVGKVKNGAVADFIDYLSQMKTAALKGSI